LHKTNLKPKTNIPFFVKTRIKNTTLYTIAFLLFLFGNSVNVIHFCCDICRVQGTQVFTENNCHEQVINKILWNNSDNSGNLNQTTPGNSRNTANSTCSTTNLNHFPFQLNHQHNTCSLENISINLDYYQQHINLIPSILSLSYIIDENRNLAESATKVHNTPLYTSAIHLAGRRLLNEICILRN